MLCRSKTVASTNQLATEAPGGQQYLDVVLFQAVLPGAGSGTSVKPVAQGKLWELTYVGGGAPESVPPGLCCAVQSLQQYQGRCGG